MADGRRGPKGLGKNANICVKEEFKIAVKIALDKFRLDESQKGSLFIISPKRGLYLCLYFTSEIGCLSPFFMFLQRLLSSVYIPNNDTIIYLFDICRWLMKLFFIRVIARVTNTSNEVTQK